VFSVTCNTTLFPAHLAPRGRHPVVQQSHVWHAYWVQLLPVHVEAHVEWHGHQQARKQHDQDTQPHGPQRNLQASLVSNHSNAVAPQKQVPKFEWRTRQQFVAHLTRRPWPFCRKHWFVYLSCSAQSEHHGINRIQTSFRGPGELSR
jgi:hypothetical protein